MLLGSETLLHPPHKHCDVRALTATIGVKLVEHEEIEANRVLDHLLVELVLPGHEQLEHHEVRKDDVGLLLSNSLALVLAFLSGVTRNGGLELFWDAGVFDKLLNFAKLRVRKRVHRIDDDSPRLGRFAITFGAHNRINDRDEEAQRLARSRTGRDDKALFGPRLNNCTLLMAMERDRFALLAKGKDLFERRIENAFFDQLVDRSALLETRIDRDQWVRPEFPGFVYRIDLISDLLRANSRERSRE